MQGCRGFTTMILSNHICFYLYFYLFYLYILFIYILMLYDVDVTDVGDKNLRR